jgi:hypothetical protein
MMTTRCKVDELLVMWHVRSESEINDFIKLVNAGRNNIESGCLLIE